MAASDFTGAYPSSGIVITPTAGMAALASGKTIRIGEPGFGAGPIYSFDGGNGVGYITFSYGPSGGASAPAAVATSTGVNPTETSYSLYGHIVPLSVFGLGRIGGEIIAGPWVVNGLASFCISFGVPADPSGSRDLLEIAFDSEVVWTLADGFSTEGFTYRWYPGTLTQAADPIEIAHYGADAVAYRPQMLMWFENLPLASTKFQKIPYVAALIQDSTGHDVNLGEAFERLAYSPWVGYTSSQFETVGITDALVGGGLIIAQDADFLSTIQQFQRFYSQWDIIQTDKLRIVDRGAAVTADINLDRHQIDRQGDPLARGDHDSASGFGACSTIDPDADYTVVPSSAKRPIVPVNVTTSVDTESVFLPMIMDSFTRQSLVTYAKYQEDVARKRVAATAMMYGLEIEPGDLVALLDLGDDFTNEVFKVIETTHGVNYAVELTLESILRCSMVVDDGTDPDFIYVVLLCGCEGIDGAKTFIDDSLLHHGPGSSANGTVNDTSQSKFGASSALVTGYSPSVIWGAKSLSDFSWNLSAANSDQFTVELWVRFIEIFGSDTVNVMIGSSYIDVFWYFGAYHHLTSGTNELVFGFTPLGGGPYVTTGTKAEVGGSIADVQLNVWNHLAVDKDHTGKIRIYVNGVPKGSSTPANSAFNDGPPGPSVPEGQIDFGCIGLFGGNRMSGWLDEVRITKGKARYKTDRGFTPPTAPFPRGVPL